MGQRMIGKVHHLRSYFGRLIIAGLFASSLLSAPAQAEVTETRDDGFVTRATARVAATPLETWLALTRPSAWWNDNHTWSGDAANMTLTPQAGGCFCEAIPGDDSNGASAMDGSSRHMEVIQAFPLRVLRMRGGLGPLQGEPATGILTITLKEIEGGTRILWEYNVGGPMRFEIAEISKAVDGVMTQQLRGLQEHLGALGEVSRNGDISSGALPPPETQIAPQIEAEALGAESFEPKDNGVTDQDMTLEQRIDALGKDE
jgi:hypothetical protein